MLISESKVVVQGCFTSQKEVLETYKKTSFLLARKNVF